MNQAGSCEEDLGLGNGDIPLENIHVSSRQAKKDDVRLGSDKLWKSAPSDIHPTIRVIFENPVELSGLKIKGNADRIKISYRDDESENHIYVQEQYFYRLPVEMSGLSKFVFSPIENVREVIVELSTGFISEPLTAQIELLGCADCNYTLFAKFPF